MALLKGQAINTIQIILTPTDIQSINSFPIDLIPAPGLHKAIDVLSVTAKLVFQSSAYTNVDIYIAGQAVSNPSQDFQYYFPNFLDAGADLFMKGLPQDAGLVIPGDNTIVENGKIQAYGNANSGTGDSPVIINVAYRIISV